MGHRREATEAGVTTNRLRSRVPFVQTAMVGPLETARVTVIDICCGCPNEKSANQLGGVIGAHAVCRKYALSPLREIWAGNCLHTNDKGV